MAQYSCDVALLSYPVLPLENDPMVVRTLKADKRSMMIVEEQLVSDLT
jgi:hypothetical protein